MPTYEYRCAANGRTVEVFHALSERLTTWGAVCARAEIPAGATDPDAPVERLLGIGTVMASRTDAAPTPARGCGGGCACHPH